MLTKDDLQVGHVYSAKKPQAVGLFDPLINDRQILHMNAFGEIQYDSPTVRNGRHYPKTTVDKFLRWAKEYITDQMPKGEWRKTD